MLASQIGPMVLVPPDTVRFPHFENRVSATEKIANQATDLHGPPSGSSPTPTRTGAIERATRPRMDKPDSVTGVLTGGSALARWGTRPVDLKAQ
jgi:hypothetical protein